ncbi:nitroreductase family protein [Oceanispirochaeta sp.]|jgi:iodotyrosine deiodinase|uniref:nitroreductase family protein n=1 Tax=Oceanispirochaeta sp. TaxID=2035350 RepID=UPI002613DE5A|nr:nitroreductase family protein [Oceanispirochaeta sp.]MDA3957397.1 nitroreductase family protein [Oceanispirochaeta sp.]
MSEQKIYNPFVHFPGYSCFGCAPDVLNTQGLGMTFRMDGERVFSDWTPPSENFQGYQGVLHGGIQATLMDEIASWFVYTLCKTSGVTKSLEVDYISPAYMKNEPFHLEAVLNKNTGKNAEINVLLYDKGKTLCTKALAVYALFSEDLARNKFGYPGVDAFLKERGHPASSGRPSSDPLVKKFQTRRSVRHFSKKKVSLQAVRDCIVIAGTSPSGANCQPWTFALVSSATLKRRIRKEAEHVETLFYERDSTKVWQDNISEMRTDANKAFLEEAPCLIVVFLQKFGRGRDGRKINHYYSAESLGMATGFLIAALHMKGFSTLPYTPAPMNFLMDLLGRPDNERPYLILPVGYASEDWTPPQLERKELDRILVEYGDRF